MPSSEGPIGVAVIGAGVMGADHVSRVAQRCGGARVVAVCDVDIDRARAAASGLRGCRPESDPWAVIGANDVDAVVVVTHYAGRWGGEVALDFRDRFAQAYDSELQSWVASAAAQQAGGPSAWDGYAAAAACDAGVEAQRSGNKVVVELAERPELYA